MRNLFNARRLLATALALAIIAGTLPASAFAQSTNKVPAGMELCAKAAEIATRFGRLAAFNVDFRAGIQTAVLNKAVGYIRDEIFGKTNIKIEELISDPLLAVGNFLSSAFNDLIENTMKTAVDNQVTEIENTLIDELSKIGRESIADISDTDDPEELLIANAERAAKLTSVPTIDEIVIARQKQTLNKLKEKLNKQIKEQKIAEVNADTRAKCAELLKTTNETIKRTLLYQLSTQIVDWIQTGKTPQFWKQPGKFLKDTGLLAVDRFISRVAPRLCEPFRLSVQLQIPSVRREDNPFYEQVTCSLNSVVANIENFYQDFRQGGWIAYNEMLKPQNNYYGASLAVIDEAAQQQAAATENARLEQARGFVPVKQCTEWAKFEPYAGPSSYVLDIRSDWEGNLYARANNAPPESGAVVGPVDANGNAVSGFVQEPQTGPLDKGVRLYSSSANYFWECLKDEITSPATVAAGLAERASQSDIDNLAASEDVSLFLQTVEDSIVNKLVKSGVRGLKNLLPRIIP